MYPFIVELSKPYTLKRREFVGMQDALTTQICLDAPLTPLLQKDLADFMQKLMAHSGKIDLIISVGNGFGVADLKWFISQLSPANVLANIAFVRRPDRQALPIDSDLIALLPSIPVKSLRWRLFDLTPAQYLEVARKSRYVTALSVERESPSLHSHLNAAPNTIFGQIVQELSFNEHYLHVASIAESRKRDRDDESGIDAEKMRSLNAVRAGKVETKNFAKRQKMDEKVQACGNISGSVRKNIATSGVNTLYTFSAPTVQLWCSRLPFVELGVSGDGIHQRSKHQRY